MLQARFRPIHQWPRPFTKSRRSSPFSVGYKATLDLLDRELFHLSAKGIVIQLAVREQEIRLDGWPKASARPQHPGVILAFQSRYGPLEYVCDEFTDWESNLRGIALTLERLRLADLYGVTKRGEQYKGWAALPPVPGEEIASADDAFRFIERVTGYSHLAAMNPENARDAYRRAAAKLHPDVGGNHEEFIRLQRAWEIIQAHHRAA